MTETGGLSRRRFIGGALTAAGTTALSAKSYAKASGANGRLNIGFIGCGSQASQHLQALMSMAEKENIAVTAVCDVYLERARKFGERIRNRGGEAKVSQDHREVLGTKDLDCVLIATPEHSHHYQVMDALESGRHVYCEKPICHNIREAKEVRKRVHETGLKFQVGIQGLSDDSYGAAYEAIRQDKLGLVVEAQIDYVRNHSLDKGPWRKQIDSAMAKPRDLDWEKWTKPRSRRPWNPHHYFEWRCYRDYSGGIATDLFVHRISRIIRACGLTYPERAVGMGGIYVWDDGRDIPDNFEMLLEYPAVEGVTNGMTVHLLGTMANKNGNRHCIRGQKATLFFTRTGWEIVDEKTGGVLETYTKSRGESLIHHHRNLLAAIRNDEALYCPVEMGLYSLVAARMGNLSWFQRKMMAWDPEGEFVVASW